MSSSIKNKFDWSIWFCKCCICRLSITAVICHFNMEILKNLCGKTFKTVPKISTIIFKEANILKCPNKYYSDLTVYLRGPVLI